MEFYKNKSEVAPRAIAFNAINENGRVTNENSDTAYKYAKDNNANIHINKRDHSEILEKLHKQNTENKNALGEYSTYSSAIIFADEKDKSKFVHNENGKYLFFAGLSLDKDRQKHHKTVKDVLESRKDKELYKPLYDTYNDIHWFSFNTYKLTSGKVLLNALVGLPFVKGATEGQWVLKQEYLRSEKILEYTIDPKKHDQTTLLAKSDLDTSYVQKGGGNRKLTSITSLTEINGLEQTSYKSRILYSRDILETLYRKTFSKKFYTEKLEKSIKDRHLEAEVKNIYDYIKWIDKQIDIDKTMTFNDDEKLLINTYQSVMYEYTNLINLSASIYTYTGHDKKGKEIELSAYDYTSGTSSFVPDDKAPLNTDAEVQKPIYNAQGYWRHGPFYGFFVWPLALITQGLRSSMPNMYGWASIFTIIIVVILTRAIQLSITWKSIVNQSKQDDIKAKKAKIDAKYAEYDKSNKQMKARHQQEIMELYKKNGINPIDSFVTAIVSMPIFVAIWRAIQCIPEIKSTHWAGIDFSSTSWREIISGNWIYLWILALSLAIQAVSQFLPKWLNMKKFKERTTLEDKAALKKADRMQNIMAIGFLFLTVVFSAGVQVYWVIGGIWTIGQVLAIHYFKKSKYYREKFLQKKKT